MPAMFEAALAAHKAGDLAEADACYREVLRVEENATPMEISA